MKTFKVVLMVPATKRVRARNHTEAAATARAKGFMPLSVKRAGLLGAPTNS